MFGSESVYPCLCGNAVEWDVDILRMLAILSQSWLTFCTNLLVSYIM